MGNRPFVTLSCVKTCFLVCAAILWFTGAGIFGVGIWTMIAKNDYEALLGSVTYVATAGMMIAAGAFAMFVCIFGIIGGIRESRFMILGFFLMITVVFLMELISGILAYVYRYEVHAELTESLNATIATKYGLPGHYRETETVDRLQRVYQCCGDVDYMSWKNSNWRKSNSTTDFYVPDSCCISPKPKCGERTHPSNIWRNDLKPLGCFTRLEDFLMEHLYILGAVGLTMGLVQITCMGLSMWLYRLIVESYY